MGFIQISLIDLIFLGQVNEQKSIFIQDKATVIVQYRSICISAFI